MSEVLSAIRLKEKILIIALMLVLTLLVGGVTGAITYATTDRHQHEFEYQLERGADGKFDFVGICQYEECSNPRYVQNILSGVSEKVKVPSTCTAPGVMEFYFTYAVDNKTYTYTEEIPVDTHTYKVEIVTDNGVSSIVGSCIYKDCVEPEISVEGASELKLEAILEGSCSTPSKELYSYEIGGVKETVTIQSGENAPHKLNGKFVTEYEISEGVYLYGTEGMILVGTPVLGCGQKTAGYFVCEECDKPVSATIGKPDHTFVLSNTGITYPTMMTDGQATLKCSVESCDVTKKATLPKAVVDENSSIISRSCAIGKQVLAYNYTIENYGVSVNLELTLPWNEHDFKYVESETKAPTVDRDGYAVLRCAFEGCTESSRVVLNKIELEDPDNKNSEVISEATERSPKKILYTYASEKYGFTINLELSVGEVLTHKYHYDLEFTGIQFDLVGRCYQSECLMPEIREENVQPECTDTSTCQQLGDLIYTYEKDGVTYTLTMVNFELGSHSIQHEDDLVKPTISRDGSVTIYCDTEGCGARATITLPKVEIGENAVIIKETAEFTEVGYYYHYEELDYEFVITLKITVD